MKKRFFYPERGEKVDLNERKKNYDQEDLTTNNNKNESFGRINALKNNKEKEKKNATKVTTNY